MAEATPIRLVLVDDHPMVRKPLRTLFSLEPDLEVVGEAGNGPDAIRLVLDLQPDVVLMDLNMPGMDGVTAMRQILAERPQTRVLMLTGSREQGDILGAIQSGARGYLLKEGDPAEAVAAIRMVMQGGSLVLPAGALAGGPAAPPAPLPPPATAQVDDLSEREVALLSLLALGLSNREIGVQLHISELTVRNNLSELYSRLKLTNRAQAGAYAIQRGLVKP